jgi:hypothetical protein
LSANKKPNYYYEAAKIIEDEDMEDSPPDTPEFWMPDRNDEDTNFVRGK